MVKKKVRRSDSFLSIAFQRRNLQETRTPPAPSLTMHAYFLLLLFQGAVSALMNSKMLRFAFQFRNLPLKGHNVPRSMPGSKSH